MNYRTSEMVGRGHPDKMCDAVGDAILTEVLKQDPQSRVAIETTGGKNLLFITGELSTRAEVVDIDSIARKALKKAGYPLWNEINIIKNIGTQSLDIRQGVDRKDEIGAGDQGIMFGYATNETKTKMPPEYEYARQVALYIDKNVVGERYGSDFKTQVTMLGDKVVTVLVSIVHKSSIEYAALQKEISQAIKEALAYDIDYDYKILINPTGRFIKGWFDADAGTTGRKIVVDNYGGAARVGGGAFSGKDYTKVDRSAAYMCRYAAKNIVANGLADRCEIQVAYAIGIAEPVSLQVNTFGTAAGLWDDEMLTDLISKKMDFRPAAIISLFELEKFDYTKVSAYGHFGRRDLPWEQITKL